MKKHIIISLFCLASLNSFSQINDWMENVVLIQSKDRTHSGSGFLYQTPDNAYLITAKHVLLGEANNLLFDVIIFQSYAKDAQKEEALEYTINLTKAFAEKKARYGNSFDIVAIQLGKTEPGILKYYDFVSKKGQASNINPFSINDCILTLDEIDIGDDIFMIGYPKSLEVTQYNNFNFNRPIARSGIISGKDYQHNTILVDCFSYGGNSGGQYS